MNSNQVQAAASVAATLLTGGVLWWEVYTRNRERRDSERAQSRLVRSGSAYRYAGAGKDRSLIGVQIVVANWSTQPVLNVCVFLLGWPGRVKDIVARWFPDVLRADTRMEFEYVLPDPVPWPEPLPNDHPFEVTLAFTDAAGLEWWRLDHEEPRRTLWLPD